MDRIPPRVRVVRDLPLPVMPEVATYSRDEGVARQLALLTVQDRWQNTLVKTQFEFSEQRGKFVKEREDMFEKVSQRLEQRLGVFVDDIKYMQRSVKKELQDLVASSADLRRLFDEENPNIIVAEKLSFILEGLEKLKSKAAARFEGSQKQLEKFSSDWKIIEKELLQVGDIFDESCLSNLEQCRMACEHASKIFAYDQAKTVAETETRELGKLRSSLRRHLTNGAEATRDAHNARSAARQKARQHQEKRAAKRASLMTELSGREQLVEAELRDLGLAPLDKNTLIREEEEIVMSYLLTQVEMEAALKGDYQSIQEATKKMAKDMGDDLAKFDDRERQSCTPTGSQFAKHRETISRHSGALNVTLGKWRLLGLVPLLSSSLHHITHTHLPLPPSRSQRAQKAKRGLWRSEPEGRGAGL
jgi:hypothetical protein